MPGGPPLAPLLRAPPRRPPATGSPPRGAVRRLVRKTSEGPGCSPLSGLCSSPHRLVTCPARPPVHRRR